MACQAATSAALQPNDTVSQTTLDSAEPFIEWVTIAVVRQGGSEPHEIGLSVTLKSDQIAGAPDGYGGRPKPCHNIYLPTRQPDRAKAVDGRGYEHSIHVIHHSQQCTLEHVMRECNKECH